MPTWLASALVGVVVLGFVLRRLTRARRSVRGDGGTAEPVVGLAVVGVMGLVLHCTAMFYRGLVTALPGGGRYAAIVDGMGLGSAFLFVVPAVLLLIGLRVIGLRRQRLLAMVASGVALLATGVTMYDGGPLPIHLGAIAASVLVLAVIVAFAAAGDGGRSAQPAGPGSPT